MRVFPGSGAHMGVYAQPEQRLLPQRCTHEEAFMSNHFAGRGNLGADPDLKHVEIDGEPRAVTWLLL
jgi:hypothetical protein